MASGGRDEVPRFVRQIGKRVIKASPILRRQIMSSSDHRVLAGKEEARRAASSSAGWLAARTVRRQERAYRGLIADMKRGQPRLDFAVAAEAIAATGIDHPRVLEVGCGSGCYSEVFATLVPGGVRYTGVDYSSAMIARARLHYPSIAFEVADATALPYPDGAFDIVFNGVSLMHIIEYEAAIREAARVAARYCIFHTACGFCRSSDEIPRAKYAYGAPIVEIIFGKAELMSLCREAGLRLDREWLSIPYDMSGVTGAHHSITETYLFAVCIAGELNVRSERRNHGPHIRSDDVIQQHHLLDLGQTRPSIGRLIDRPYTGRVASHDVMVRNVPSKSIQADEIWSFDFCQNWLPSSLCLRSVDDADIFGAIEILGMAPAWRLSGRGCFPRCSGLSGRIADNRCCRDRPWPAAGTRCPWPSPGTATRYHFCIA